MHCRARYLFTWKPAFMERQCVQRYHRTAAAELLFLLGHRLPNIRYCVCQSQTLARWRDAPGSIWLTQASVCVCVYTEWCVFYSKAARCWQGCHFKPLALNSLCQLLQAAIGEPIIKLSSTCPQCGLLTMFLSLLGPDICAWTCVVLVGDICYCASAAVPACLYGCPPLRIY